MRKDVILGMSIGGILLAILVVYLTASPSAKVKSAIKLDTGDGTTDVQGSGPGDADGASGADRSNDIGAAAAGRLAGRSSTDAAGSMDGAPARPSTDGARPAAATVGSADTDRKDPVWGKRLYGNTPLIGVAETPGNGTSGGSPSGDASGPTAGGPTAPTPQYAYSGEIRPAPGDLSSGSLNRSAPAATGTSPATRPSQILTARQHKVAQGESFSSISAAVYGSPHFYPHILRANPGLDPRKLKPGMVINLPDPADVKPADHAATEPPVVALFAPDTATPPSAGGTPRTPRPSAVSADGSKEYRVQSGDNLHRIAIKAYGKISMVNAIYEANKQAIGPDMAKLKLGMVLKLPPATAPAAAPH